MEIDITTVDKLADLSKLNFENEAKAAIVKDLNNMLSFVNKLNELDTEGLAPLVYMTDETNILRNDEVKHDLTQADALKNAPKRDSDYFKMPKVLDK